MSSKSEVIGAEAKGRASREPLIDRLLKVLSSVRFGLLMLALLVLSCFLGMAIMQSNVQGFETYYETLTNSEKWVFTTLGLFNVYGTWWFQTLLALTSLSIILASIDHFPGAWRYVTRPKKVALAPYVKRQMVNATVTVEGESQEEIAGRIAASLRKRGLKGEVTRKGDAYYVFAQSGVWNRIGPYFIHVTLLIIFFGGFLTSRFSQNGQLPLVQGGTTSVFEDFVQEWDGRRTIRNQMPFTVTADKIEQRLLDPAGGLEASNTLDWITRITINDSGVTHKAIVHLNKPYDYKGYRFFQSGFDGGGDASEITVSVVGADGSARQVLLAKGEAVDVDGVGALTFTRFYGDFDEQIGGSHSDTYDNPAAEIQVRTRDGADETFLALNRDVVNARGGKPEMADGVGLVLEAYAKCNSVHVLSVQKDPGVGFIYWGSGLITLALAFTFFVPHRRVWAVVGPIRDGAAEVTIGGNTNRLKQRFEEQFKAWTRSLANPTAASETERDEDDDE